MSICLTTIMSIFPDASDFTVRNSSFYYRKMSKRPIRTWCLSLKCAELRCKKSLHWQTHSLLTNQSENNDERNKRRNNIPQRTYSTVASSRSRLPISWTSWTNTANLVSSCISADEMLVNPVLGIDVLYDASDPGAAFDSQDHYNRLCFPSTEQQYIADITSWVTESANPL